MKRRTFALIVAGFTRSALAGEPEGTWARVLALRADDRFAVPDGLRWSRYAALVRDLALAAPSGALPPDAATRAGELDLDLERRDDVIWLADRMDTRCGDALLALRLGPLSGDLVLEAPHPWFDRGTAEIAAALFDAGEVRAALIGTAHRRAGDTLAPDASDPTRNPDLLFQAATLGLSEAILDPLFVQLHGFAEETTDFDAVLSAGRARVDAAEYARERAAVTEALAAVLARPARVADARQVRALAASRNVQAAMLAGTARFLHIEMSSDLRATLVAREDLRGILGAALLSLAPRAQVPR